MRTRYRGVLCGAMLLGSGLALAAPLTPADTLRNGFINEFWGHRQLMQLWFDLEAKPNTFQPFGGADNLKKSLAMFKEVHAACTGKYQGVTDDPRRARSEPVARYSEWCKMAAQGDQLVKKAVRNHVAYLVDEIGNSYQKQAETLVAAAGALRDWNEKYYQDPDKVKAEIATQVKDELAMVGWDKPPAEAFGKVDKALAELLKKIDENLPSWKCEPDGTPKPDAFVKKQYTDFYKGAKVIKMYQKTKPWQVRLDHRGVPTHRAYKGMIVFKLPKEKWCRTQEWDVIQDFQGGKKFGPSYFEHSVGDGVTRICTCP